MAYNIFLSVSADCKAAKALDVIDEKIHSKEKNDSSVPLYELFPEMEMPTAKIDGIDYIGIIDMPDIDVVLPVAADWNYKKLRNAPCRFSGSAYTKDLVICGHNYNTHFGKLSRLKIGDTVVFSDVDCNIFSYTVKEVETIKPTEVEKMIKGDCDLTLFTCNLSGNARIAVRLIQDN